MRETTLTVGLDVSPLAAARTGIGRYTYELLAALWADEAGDRLVPLAHRSSVRGALPPAPGPFVDTRLGGPRSPSRAAWTLGLLPVWLGRARLDVFHATSYYAPIPRRLPTVVTIHDLGTLVHPELHPRSRVLRARALLPAVARAADAVIVPTHSVAAEAIERLALEPRLVHVVPEAPAGVFAMPIDASDVAAVLARYGLDRGFFLAVGTLEPRKNLRATIEALAMLRAAGCRDARLVVVGPNGWKFGPVRDLVRRLDGSGSVRFLGFVPDRDLAAIMQAAVALVYPSLYEGFGLPIVEAMAAGLAVITSNAGAAAEVAGDAALLVDPHAPAAIAGALVSLLEPDVRSRLSTLGRARAATFSWGRTARETLAVYRSAAGTRAAA